MFNIFKSHSLAELAQAFSESISVEEDNPLSKPWIVVQNNEIKEWLSLQIAKQQGIAGNFKFIFPSEFLWTLYRLHKNDIPQILPSDLNSMHWTLFEIFSSSPSLLEQIPFYGTGLDTPRKRFQLCGQLADNFDQYQVYRPDMMENWLERKLVTKETNERWQLSVWNLLNEQWSKHEVSKELPSRSKAYKELVSWLENPGHSIWSEIPNKVYVFGLSHLSHPFLEIISRIGNKKNVDFFTLEKPEYNLSDSFEKVLADWSRSAKEQDLLLEDILNQQDIPFRTLNIKTTHQAEFPEFKVHSCHNIRREAQVLKDEILKFLDQNRESRASDILIMVPDAEAYSGVLETIFEEEEGEPSLPISRISGQGYHSAGYALCELLELLSSAFKTSDLLQFLNHDAIKINFSFSDSDIELLEDWVLENRIYRGIGDDFNTRYSWQKGANQLLSGFCMEPDSLTIYNEIVPYRRISSTEDALLAARFSHFIHKIKKAAEEISKQKNPTGWLDFTRELVDDFIGEKGNKELQVDKIRRILDKLKEQALFTASKNGISYDLVKDWLIKQLISQSSSSGRFGQGITVSSYIPYRSVPFRFIAMLGMNESVFPRKAIRPEFDLINAEPKPGDRILKEDDTYLFLECIQAAQDHLHISYRGQDQHSDSIRLPSILVQQLLDTLYDSQNEGIIRHSLHPFNKQYFDNAIPRSYSGLNKKLSEKIQKQKSIGQPVFVADNLKLFQDELPDQIHILDLISFFNHPCKYLLQNGLNISGYNDFKEIIDRESFKLGNLERYKLDHLLFETLRKGKSADKVMKFASVSTMIPEALAGDKVFRKEKESISALIEQIKSYTEAEEHVREVSIEIDGIQLYGTIHGLFDDMLVSYRVGKRRAEHELEHWLKHLLLLESGYEVNRSLYLSKDGADVDILEIKSNDILNNPIKEYMGWFLGDLLALQKAAFFPQSSKAYAEAILNGKNVNEAVMKAKSKWELNPHKTFAEEADYYNALVWRGFDPIESTAFKENALKFWEPFLITLKEGEDISQPLNVFEAPMTGISLVEASAGTGKTYNITSLYVRAILENELDPSQILVMTYTEAATAELKFRLRNRLKGSLKAINEKDSSDDDFLEKLINQNYVDAAQKLKAAIDQFDEAAVFTIHGFCSRLLTEYSLQFGVSPNFELLTDQSVLLQDCVDDYWRSFIRSADKDPNKLILLDYLTDEGFGPDELKSVADEVLSHSNSEVIPDDYKLNRLYKLVGKLQHKFQEVVDYWEEEGEELEKIYRGDALNRGIYRKSTEESDWIIFQDWINNNTAKIWYSDRLEKFGTKISKSGKKSAPDIPELNISRAIDEYMMIADQLKMLKIVFIQQSIEVINQRFKDQKKKSNLLSYNDLLETVEEGLRSDSSGKLAERLSRKYPLALVDEFQDTDPTQYGIFKQIYYQRKNTALFMIGDPKQAIYGFRGADIFTYLVAKNDSSESQSYTLSENFRSNSSMIKGVNELFGQSDSPFVIEGLSFQPAQFPSQKDDTPYLKKKSGEVINPLQTIILDEEKYTSKGSLEGDIYTTVCNEVADLLSGDYQIHDRDVQEKDIAILIRKGFQGEKIQHLLREKGYKSVLKSRTSVFSTREADELFLVLKAILKVSNEPGLRAALSTEILGFTAADLQSMLQNGQSWSAIIQKFVHLNEIWDDQGIESAIERLLHIFHVQERLSIYTDAERRITNLIHLSELLGKAQREHQIYKKALLNWFFQKQQDENADSDAEQLRLESDEDLIQISTIHSSKGLQYPIVICPFLWDTGAEIKANDILKFHKDGVNYIDISQGVVHPEREYFEQLTERQQMAEEVRLAYVALTRSVAASFMIVPDYNKIDKSPLSSILHGAEASGSKDLSSMKYLLEQCNHIQVRPPLEGNPKKRKAESNKPVKLKAAQFQRRDIFHYPRMLSYSSLAEGRGQSDSAHDYDELQNFDTVASTTIDKYGFPKGANAGTCLHKIFEDISFESPENLQEVVADNLDYYGFEDQWRKPVGKWIKEALMMDLGIPKVNLSSVKDDNVLKEMEFYFPVENLHADELWNLIRSEKPIGSDIDQTSGFIKGFIDLIFRAGDQYFILDYKSNHLGDTKADYSSENLSQAIKDAGYDLQYHIYSLALHRFLRKRLNGYEYDKNFGGILYLFLRGVDKDRTGSGVFFDKPDLSLINQLDAYFKKGGRLS